MDTSKKKKVVIFLAGACIVGGIWFFVEQKSGDGSAVGDGKNIQIKERVTANDFLKDSDNDGLKDWEEELTGTNPKSADTDGDGISDFDEAREVAGGGWGASLGAPPTDTSGEEYVSNTAREEKGISTVPETKKKITVSLPPKPVLFRAEFSQETAKSVTITLKGTGFTKKNIVRTGFQNFYDVSSADGTSLTVVFAPDIPENKPGVVSNLPFAIYVDNENGLSNPLLFTLVHGEAVQ